VSWRAACHGPGRSLRELGKTTKTRALAGRASRQRGEESLGSGALKLMNKEGVTMDAQLRRLATALESAALPRSSLTTLD